MNNKIYNIETGVDAFLDTRATELLTMRLTPEDKHRIWIISNHFNISMARVVHEGLWMIFPLADKMMKQKKGPNFFC